MTTLVSSSFSPFDILPDDPAPVVEVIPASKPLPKSLQQAGTNGNNYPAITAEGLEKALETRRAGRMSLFTLDNAALVIEGIENGDTMETIGKHIGVGRQAIWTWMQLVPEFSDAVSRAREMQGHALADSAVDIIENADITSADPKQNMAELRKCEQIGRIKMQLAGCFNFRQYGDKKQQLNVNLNAEVRPIDLTKYA